MKKRLIKDTTTGEYFKAYDRAKARSITMVNTLKKGARYSMSQGDSEAIERILTVLKNYNPSHEFEVETYDVVETWTKIE